MSWLDIEFNNDIDSSPETNFDFFKEEFKSSKITDVSDFVFETMEKKFDLCPLNKERKPLGQRIIKQLSHAAKQQEKEESDIKKPFRLYEGTVPDQFIPFNKIQKIDSKKHQFTGIEVGSSSCQGMRREMQDEHLVEEFSFTIGDQFHQAKVFAVFDGHGHSGDDCEASTYVKINFVRYLEAALTANNEKKLTDEGIWKALKATFVLLDHDYPETKDGTTASVALVLGDKVWVANAGDSRTILWDGEKVVRMSADNKPENKKDLKTIKSLGGFVINNRVGGSLSVSRAIGDKELKVCLRGKWRSFVSPECKITHYPLEQIQKDGFILLACDGLWDVASDKQASDAVATCISNGESVDEISKRLVYSAIKNSSSGKTVQLKSGRDIKISGSSDNVTAMIVKFTN